MSLHTRSFVRGFDGAARSPLFNLAEFAQESTAGTRLASSVYMKVT
jgi:hypothetical protein